MLDKIQTKIVTLSSGKKLILGTGIREDEMHKVIELCNALQSSGVIKIVNSQSSTIMIQKL